MFRLAKSLRQRLEVAIARMAAAEPIVKDLADGLLEGLGERAFGNLWTRLFTLSSTGARLFVIEFLRSTVDGSIVGVRAAAVPAAAAGSDHVDAAELVAALERLRPRLQEFASSHEIPAAENVENRGNSAPA